MIIWSGWGILVVLLVSGLMAGARMAYPHLSFLHGLMNREIFGIAASCFLGGVITWFLGRAMNDGARRSEARHTLFFIPMEYWSFILVGAGIYFVADKLRHPASASESASTSPESRTLIEKTILAGTNATTALESLRELEIPARILGISKIADTPDTWVFQIVDKGGRQTMVHLGDRYRRWSVKSFTDNELVFEGSDGDAIHIRK